MSKIFKQVIAIGMLMCFVVPLMAGIFTPLSVADIVGDSVMEMKAPIENVGSSNIVEPTVVESVSDVIINSVSIPEPNSDLDMSGEFWNLDSNGFDHSVLPINYRDGDDWNEIDTSILSRANESFGDEYSAVCNRNKYDILFKDNSQLDEYVSVISKVYIGDVEYKTAIDVTALSAYYYNGIAYDYIANGSGNLSIDYGNVALYDIYDGILERYVITASGIKHYYIVNDLPSTTLGNAVLSIPFGIHYNSIEYSLYNGDVEINQSGEFSDITFINRVSQENAYSIEPITVLNISETIGTGIYYVDYNSGDIIVYANISYSLISSVEGVFVIDPVWNVEYTSTGRIDSQKYIRDGGDADWYDLDTAYDGEYTYDPLVDWYHGERVEYTPRSVYPNSGRSVITNPYYDGFVDSSIYSVTFDGTEGQPVSGNKLSTISTGVWDGVSGAYYAQNDGKDCGLLSVRQQMYTTINMRDQPFRFNRDVEIRYSFNFNCTNYSTGSYTYFDMMQSFSTVDSSSVPNFSPNLLFIEYQDTTSGYAYVKIPIYANGSNPEVFAQVDLVQDEWYEMEYINFEFLNSTGYGGYNNIELDIVISNSTALISSNHCVWNYSTWIWSASGLFDFTMKYEGGSGDVNVSRGGRFLIDDFYYTTGEEFDLNKRGYMYTQPFNTTIINDIYGEELFKYDVFTANVYHPYYMLEPTRNAGVMFVEYYNEMIDDWVLIPDNKLEGNSAGFKPYYLYYDTNVMYDIGAAVSIFVIDLSFVDASVYNTIRVLWVMDSVPYSWGGTFLTQFDLWYVKGDDTFISAQPLSTKTVSNILSHVRYIESDWSFRFTCQYSLFGLKEPLAGSRIYYMADTTYPSYPTPQDDGWVQITNSLYMWNDGLGKWIEYNGDYNYLPTDTVKFGLTRSNGGNIIMLPPGPPVHPYNKNYFMWYPNTDVPEGDYWCKVETINAGFTLKMIIVSDMFQVVYNQAPVVAITSVLSCIGRNTIELNVLDEGSYDDGGDDNIVLFTYEITSPYYNETLIRTVPTFEFSLPDDGNYTLSITLQDSMGLTTTESFVVVNYNADPGVYIGFKYYTDKKAVIVDATPSVGDLYEFNLLSSADSDGNIVSYYVDYGDGYTETVLPDVGQGVVLEHVYLQKGIYKYYITATDDDFNTTTITGTKAVGNTATGVVKTDDTVISVSNEGIPISPVVETIDAGSNNNWVAKHLFKESLSLIIVKNDYFETWSKYRTMNDIKFDKYEKTTQINIDILYFNNTLHWNKGAKFFTDVYVFGVSGNTVDLLSVDLYSELNSATAPSGNIVIDVESSWEKIVVITNPDLMLKMKVLFGARGIDSYQEATAAAVPVSREEYLEVI